MKPVEELTQLFEAWRLLSHQEQTAIRCDDWLEVSRMQESKMALQPRIIELCKHFDCFEENSPLERLKGELVTLEKENGLLVAQKRLRTGKRLLETGGTLRNLRQLRRYCGQQSRESWVSFS